MANIAGGSIVWILDADTGEFNRAMLSAEKQAKSTSENIDKTTSASFKSIASSVSSSFNGVADTIAGVAKSTAALVIGGAFGLKSFIDQASELQSVTASFQSLTGSAEATQSVLAQLYDFSFKTAFSASDINKAARSFLSAGVEVKDLGGILQDVGDIAGATGANLGQLTLPLQQALAKGKLQTQDFNQIMDAGAGAIGKALKEKVAVYGYGNIQDAMQDGIITSKILFDTIHEQVQEGGFAFQGALKQSLTFTGQMSNLQETIGNVGLEIIGVNKRTGEIDKNGLFAKLLKIVQDLTVWFNANKVAIKEVALAIMDNVLPALAAITAAYVTLKTVAAISAIIADPFILVPILIAAVVAGLTFLQVKFNIFGEAWETIKGAWDGATKFFSDIFDSVSKKMTEIFGNIGKWFEDRWKEASDGAKKGIDNISKWLGENETAIKTIATILGVVFGPALIKAGVLSAITMAKIAADGIAAGAGWVAGAVASTAGWVVNSAKMLVLSIALKAGMLKDSIVAGAAWVAGAVKASISWAIETAKIIASSLATGTASALHAADAGWAWVFNATRASFAWVTTELPKIVAGFVVTSAASLLHAGQAAVAWVINAATASFAWVTTELPKIVLGFLATSGAAIVQALVASGAWIASASASAIAWVITELPRIVAAFIVTSGAAVVQAAVASGAWIAAAVSSSEAFVAFSALIATPLVMPAIVVAAAIASIMLVWDAATKAMSAIDELNATKSEIAKNDQESLQKVNARINDPNNTAEDIAKAKKVRAIILNGMEEQSKIHMANGGIIKPTPGGTDINVAEAGQAEAVIPLPKLNEMLSGGTGKNEFTYNIDTINIGSEVDGERWLQKLTKNQEITSKGLVPQQAY